MKNFRKIEKEYQNLQSNYKLMTLKAETLLTELLNSNNVSSNIIEARTKSLDSYMNKVKSKSAKYTDPINDITDIIGIRVIVNYQDDVDKVIEVIQREFEIDYHNSIDKGKLLNPNEFGYRSIHYVVSISKDRVKLTEWTLFENIKFEIQVRTILQHSWALISHSLQYKKDKDVPISLKRKLYRLAGLIELADDEFISLRNDHTNLIKKIDNQSIEDLLSIELNILSMKRFIQSSEMVAKLKNIKYEVGFEDCIEDEEYDYDESVSELLIFCETVRLVTVNDINNIIEKSLTYAKRYLTDLISETSGTWTAGITFILCLIIVKEYINDNGVIELINENWHKSIVKLVTDVIDNLDKEYVLNIDN